MLGQTYHDELAWTDRTGQFGTKKANTIGLACELHVFDNVHGGMDQRRHVGFGSLFTLRSARSVASRNNFSSMGRKGRDLPRAKRPSPTGPMAVRRSRSTLCLRRANIRRISRFLPSLRMI